MAWEVFKPGQASTCSGVAWIDAMSGRKGTVITVMCKLYRMQKGKKNNSPKTLTSRDY